VPKINLRGQRGKSVPPEKRFWLQVEKTPGCWLWVGNLGIGGYGRIVVNGVKVKAHRYSWEIHNGPVPDGLFVCHSCDRPGCVRPDHLFLGTNADNRRDSVEKGRHAVGYRMGEDCHFAKLSADDAREIRRRHVRRSRGPNGTKAMAAEFGVLPEAIRRVLRGNSWKEYGGVGRHQGPGRKTTR
jgi:hypothetical protein